MVIDKQHRDASVLFRPKITEVPDETSAGPKEVKKKKEGKEAPDAC